LFEPGSAAYNRSVMPRKRRSTRPVRRPNFRPAPEPAPAEDNNNGAPALADTPVAAIPGLSATGPVETRPHWNARTDRVQGRRLAQIRRSMGEQRVAGRGATGQLPTLERAYVTREVRQITLTTVAIMAVIVVLAIVLR